MLNLKKSSVLFFVLLYLNLVSATLQITKIPVKEIIIAELNEPAIFDLEINNSGEADNFEVYTLVGGIEIKPQESFYIESGETKKITVRIYFDKKVLKGRESLSFEYGIAGRKSGVTKDIFSVRVYNFETALSINAENIKLNQKEAKIYVKNRIDYNFENLNLKVSSEFFSENFNLSLKPFEEKILTVKLDQHKLGKAVGGNYILTSIINFRESSEKVMSIFSFEEKTDIKTEEKTSGWLIRKFSSKKINQGNLPVIARVIVKKNWFSKLFTTLNVKPFDVEREGFSSLIIFEKELQPGELLYVEVKTNYIIPLTLVILIVIGSWLFVYYFFQKKDLEIRKKTALVKTKKGEFALKVTLFIRALKNIEKVTIIESIPPLVKLYSRFGILRPDRIDEKNRRIEWDFEVLNKDEERVLSYVIYSKLGIFGRFDLPETAAVYEENGKIYETKGNKVVLYFNEAKE